VSSGGVYKSIKKIIDLTAFFGGQLTGDFRGFSDLQALHGVLGDILGGQLTSDFRDFRKTDNCNEFLECCLAYAHLQNLKYLHGLQAIDVPLYFGNHLRY